jgi:hypothetical protein
MDTENLLRQIAAVPLGPLAVSCVSAGADAWTLTVTLADGSRSIRAEREPKTEGVVLTCRLDSAAQLAVRGSWITEDEAVLGGSTERRLWIHGDGLNAALLLNALAELARVAAEVPAESRQLFTPAPTSRPLSETAPEEPVPEELPVVVTPVAEAAAEESPLAVETPPEEEPSVEPAPEPAPAPKAKLLPWQSLGTVPSPKPPPMPEEVPEPEVAEAEEPAVLDAPDPEVSPVETPAMETAAEPDRQLDEPPATSLVVANEPVTPALPPTPAVESPASTASASLVSQVPQPVPPSPEPAVLPVPGDPPQPVGHTGTCRECGTPFAADHAFCTNCGIRLA